MRTSEAEEGTLQCTRRGHSAWTRPVRDEKVALGLRTSHIINEERNEKTRADGEESGTPCVAPPPPTSSHTDGSNDTTAPRELSCCWSRRDTPLLLAGHRGGAEEEPRRGERLLPPRAHQALAPNTSRREPPLLTMAGWASEGRGAGWPFPQRGVSSDSTYLSLDTSPPPERLGRRTTHQITQ